MKQDCRSACGCRQSLLGDRQRDRTHRLGLKAFSSDSSVRAAMLHGGIQLENRGMDWQAIRDEFPVTRRWAFFDHAAVAPISGRAQRALAEWAADMAENGDVH